MEKEVFLSGYCRVLDSPRTVCIVTENGKLVEADCDFPSCSHIKECTVAKSIAEQIHNG